MNSEAMPLVKPRSFRLRRLLSRLWNLRTGVAGGLVVVVVSVMAVLAPVLAPYDPYEGEILNRLRPPAWMERGSAEFLLGTDLMGRDYLSRIMHGTRISLTVAALAVAFSCTLGTLLGLLAGYCGRSVDWIISVGLDVMMAFPFVLLALAVIAVVGPSLPNMIAVLGITGWPLYTRVIRAESQRLKVLEFVLAARTLGASDVRIIVRHLFPNLFNAILVIASLEVARMIILEAFLSFLGLGVQPPTPSWGGMLGEARELMFDRWWMAAFPGMAIFVTTLAINLFGDGLRDWFDPYSKNY